MGNPFTEFKNALGKVLVNPTTKWITLAGFFRFFETFSIVYYLPVFFQKVYPLFKTEYGYYNAAIVAGCGFISTILGGLISDRYEKKNRMTKAYVCMVGSALAIPALSLIHI